MKLEERIYVKQTNSSLNFGRDRVRVNNRIRISYLSIYKQAFDVKSKTEVKKTIYSTVRENSGKCTYLLHGW